MLKPPQCTVPQLDHDRQLALDAFVAERGQGSTTAYVEFFEAAEPLVRQLFAVSDNLRSFRAETVQQNPDLLDAARQLAGPPLSADDLMTITGTTRAQLRRSSEAARLTAEVLASAWDPIRFPWLVEDREPSDAEIHTALLWTTGIWAVERLRTHRRGESSRRQEDFVAAALASCGCQEVKRIRSLQSLDQLERGTFCRESNLAGSKCDLPVRLHDGRLLALECKVSNSALNSVKRLIRETGGKSRVWTAAFGQQVITGAVLAGVYRLGSLVDAQNNHNVVLFWEHDLAPLTEFVSRARA